MKKIVIDFQGGAHGNYLEYVCNRFLAGVAVNDLPFNQYGAAHNKNYKTKKIFYAGHFTTWSRMHDIDTNDIISIKIVPDDLLSLSAVSLLRAGDYGYDNQYLEIDTYHKLNNNNYRSMLATLLESFFQNQVAHGYQEIKDPSWPDVSTVKEFQSLPDWIIEECKNVHNFQPLVLDAEHPDCPRFVLREFFKIGFKRPLMSGFMTWQQKMIYAGHHRVFHFPFSIFYQQNEFIEQIENIGDFFGFHLHNVADLRRLHEQFLVRQIYKDHKKNTDLLIQRIVSKESFDLPKLDLLQESYIDAWFENVYNKESIISVNRWFRTSRDIRMHFDV